MSLVPYDYKALNDAQTEEWKLRMMRSADDIERVADMILKAWVASSTIESPGGLVAEDEGRPAHDLRVKTWHLAVDGVSGRVNQAQFFDMVNGIVLDTIKKVTTAAPAGDWQPVAYQIGPKFITRSERRIRAGIDLQDVINPGMSNGRPTDNEQQHELVKVKQELVHFNLVLADIASAPPVDLLYEEKGLKFGAMHAYAQTGLIKSMPKAMKAERDKAKTIINSFYDGNSDFFVDSSGLSKADLARFVKLRGLLDDADLLKVFDLGEKQLAFAYLEAEELAPLSKKAKK